MQRRDNFTHLILAGVVVLNLTLLMVGVDAQAWIAFTSEREGNMEIYVMDDDGRNLRRLTNMMRDSPHGHPMASVSPSCLRGRGAGKST